MTLLKHLCECAYVVCMSVLPVESVGVDQKGLEMCFGWP